MQPEIEDRGSTIDVLVVEDSATARALLAFILKEDPAIRVVGEASSGRQAVEMAARLRPDVITMDLVTPDIDGLEAMRRIMRHRPVPILIVTAHADSPEIDIVFEALKAGAVDVVRKPVGPAEPYDGDWGRDLAQRVKDLSGAHPRPIEQED
jgi:two-component system chemotaxis response regulator CheB